jgi:CSLREA domain-containing protein/uncharacterized repeat protein (TIGR01451 family)
MTIFQYYSRFMLLAAAVSCPATAATFTVNSTMDNGGSCAPGSANCTLRAAIQAANGTPGANTINVPAGTYLLSQSTMCAIRTNGDPTIRPTSIVALCITGNVTILGAGAGSTVIDAQQQDRVMVVSADATAQISGVTLQNGSTNGNSSPTGANGGGGAINNQGSLTISACALLTNTSLLDGGAIWSAGSLTVESCSIANNIANFNESSGGGVYAAFGTANISYSTLHGNSVEANGGAVATHAATVSITGSTLDANAARSGGGVSTDTQGSMTLTNVTISGNTAENAGGGVNSLGTLIVNSVTIALNNAQNAVGGMYVTGPTTLGNTLIWGNTATNFIPDLDCLGDPIVSKGYNLLPGSIACSFSGDQTGNLSGVDPMLTILQDNGGGTFTHALAAGSPAVDAGSPSAPGSGGNACALADQRGIFRPLGTRCDIGAFERSPVLSIVSITTNHAASSGPVETVLRGGGLGVGTTALLRMAGQPNIGGSSLYVDPGGALLSATFDLTSAAFGSWDVVVSAPDGTTVTLPAAFRVDAAQSPQLWSSISGPSAARVGAPTSFYLTYGNKGNADALAVPLTFTVPAGYGLATHFPVSPPPAQTGQVSADWSTAPIFLQLPQAGATNVSLLLPIIPAGFTGSLKFSVTPPDGGTAAGILVTAPLGTPLMNPGPDPNATAQAAAGAQAYALANLGVTIPNSHLPAIAQYAANQLTMAVAAGRTEMGFSFGGLPLVYSLAQFEIDAANFGGANAASAPRLLENEAADQSSKTWFKPRTGSGSVGAVIGGSILGTVCATIAAGYGGGIAGLASNAQLIAQCTDFLAPQPPAPPLPPAPPPPPPPKCSSIPNHAVSTDGTKCVPQGKVDCSFPKNLLHQIECYLIPIVNALDPNDKAGPQGAGNQQFQPGSAVAFPYTIQFENLSTATAAAQTVVVTDQLDTSTLDLSTFSLGRISFGAYTTTPPAGSKSYSIAIDLRPAQNIMALINASLNQNTGLVTWTFSSLDPGTQQLTTDPLAGFLPPNATPPQGNATLVYTVNPKANLATGTVICNQATVVFDANAPIKTPNYCNTIDATTPASRVQALPATQSSVSFPVQWSGTDVGSGIGDFTVYVSDNSGAFTPFQTGTTATQATYTGAPGHSYRFYSIAEDAVENAEPAKTVAEATTAIPTCATDATAQLTAVRSGFRLNTTTHQYQQTVTLTNKTAQTLTGPFAFVVDGLSAGSTLFGPAGTTSCAAPSGSPYVTIPQPSGNNWNAGQSVTVGLNFVDPGNTGITYTLRVLAGTPIR